MRWKNQRDKGEETAEKLRNKHKIGERNGDRKREPAQDEKGRALGNVYTHRCTRSQDFGMNPKQLSWGNLQHIHTAGEEWK